MPKHPKDSTATLISLHVGKTLDFTKNSVETAQVEFDGFVGDKHRGHMRGIYEGEPYPVGTIKRNDRQWSAVSIEELAMMTEGMNLQDNLTADTLGANLCFEGIPNFSGLPKGTKLLFPSGAALIVEDYNPPCHYMSEEIAKTYMTLSGESPGKLDFLKVAKKLRGLVGVIDVAGEINQGDEVHIKVFDAERMKNFLAE